VNEEVAKMVVERIRRETEKGEREKVPE